MFTQVFIINLLIYQLLIIWSKTQSF